MLDISYASSLSPRLESELATLFTPSPSRVGHPGDPYTIPDQEGANVLATICLHTQTRGNVSPSRGQLPGMTLASALKSRSSPGVRLDLLASGY